MRRDNGFTLIEIVVVVSVLTIIMMTVTNVMVSSFRARGRVDINDRLEQNGSSVLTALKDVMVGADKSSVQCSGNSVTFTNRLDGESITYSCSDGVSGKIASQSATTEVLLTSQDVVPYNCAGFVTCTPLSAEETATVDFKFVLATVTQQDLGVGETLAREFSQKVVLRN